MTDELEKKVRQAVSLIQKAVGDKVVEVAYSGGKDSDVIAGQQPHYVCGMSVPPVMMAQVASRIYDQWLTNIKK